VLSIQAPARIYNNKLKVLRYKTFLTLGLPKGMFRFTQAYYLFLQKARVINSKVSVLNIILPILGKHLYIIKYTI